MAVFALAMLVPSLAAAVRRLHDTDRSGWWLLIALIPLVGAIALLVLLALEGTKEQPSLWARSLWGRTGLRLTGAARQGIYPAAPARLSAG